MNLLTQSLLYGKLITTGKQKERWSCSCWVYSCRHRRINIPLSEKWSLHTSFANNRLSREWVKLSHNSRTSSQSLSQWCRIQVHWTRGLQSTLVDRNRFLILNGETISIYLSQRHGFKNYLLSPTHYSNLTFKKIHFQFLLCIKILVSKTIINGCFFFNCY